MDQQPARSGLRVPPAHHITSHSTFQHIQHPNLHPVYSQIPQLDQLTSFIPSVIPSQYDTKNVNVVPNTSTGSTTTTTTSFPTTFSTTISTSHNNFQQQQQQQQLQEQQQQQQQHVYPKRDPMSFVFLQEVQIQKDPILFEQYQSAIEQRRLIDEKKQEFMIAMRESIQQHERQRQLAAIREAEEREASRAVATTAASVSATNVVASHQEQLQDTPLVRKSIQNEQFESNQSNETVHSNVEQSIQRIKEPALTISVPENILQQLRTVTFGLDERLHHMQLFCCIVIKALQATSDAYIDGTTTTRHILDSHFAAFAIWGYQAGNVIHFPPLLYNYCNEHYNITQQSFDNPEIQKIFQNGSYTTFWKILSENIFIPRRVNDIYTIISELFLFLSTFDPTHLQDITHPRALIKGLLHPDIIQLITFIQNICYPQALYEFCSIDTVQAHKISKKYSSFGASLARGASIWTYHTQQQNKVLITRTNRVLYQNPSEHFNIYILMGFVRFYSLLISTQTDVYCIGMAVAIFNRISPLFHYIHIGTHLYAHLHRSTQENTIITTANNNNNNNNQISRETSAATILEQFTTIAQPPTIIPTYTICHTPCCLASSPALTHFTATPIKSHIDMIQSKLELLCGYLQSAPMYPALLQFNQALLQMDLGKMKFRGQRRAENLQPANMETLVTILRSVHSMYAQFSQQFSKNMVLFRLLPHISETNTQFVELLQCWKQQTLFNTYTTIPFLQQKTLLTIFQNSTWEQSPCCGYFKISKLPVSMPLHAIITQYVQYDDPQHLLSSVIHRSESRGLIADLLPDIELELSQLQQQQQQQQSQQPSQQLQQQPSSLFQLAFSIPYPILQPLPRFIPTINYNKPEHRPQNTLLLVFNFLWKFIAVTFNSKITPLSIRIWSTILPIVGHKIITVFGHTGRQLLLSILNTLQKQQMKEQLLTLPSKVSTEMISNQKLDYTGLLDDLTMFQSSGQFFAHDDAHIETDQAQSQAWNDGD